MIWSAVLIYTMFFSFLPTGVQAQETQQNTGGVQAQRTQQTTGSEMPYICIYYHIYAASGQIVIHLIGVYGLYTYHCAPFFD